MGSQCSKPSAADIKKTEKPNFNPNSNVNQDLVQMEFVQQQTRNQLIQHEGTANMNDSKSTEMEEFEHDNTLECNNINPNNSNKRKRIEQKVEMSNLEDQVRIEGTSNMPLLEILDVLKKIQIGLDEVNAKKKSKLDHINSISEQRWELEKGQMMSNIEINKQKVETERVRLQMEEAKNEMELRVKDDDMKFRKDKLKKEMSLKQMEIEELSRYK